MANLFPYLALAATRGLTGALAGRQQADVLAEQRRRQRVQDVIAQQTFQRQQREAELGDQARARQQALEDLANANPGAPILPGQPPVEAPDPWQATHGGEATADPDVIAAGGYYTRPSQGTLARQRSGAEALAGVLQQKFPDVPPETFAAMDAPTRAALLKEAFQPPTAYKPLTAADAVRLAAEKADAAARARARYAQPKAGAVGHYSAVPGVDPATGRPTVYRLNSLTGEVSSSGVERPAPSGAAGSAAGQLTQARMQTAAQQAASADADMSAYEDKVLRGEAAFTSTDAYLAKQMLHGGPGTSTMAEASLNRKNPDLAAYVRGAKITSSAERMITPRGGSNALMGAETLLSGAGPGANAKLIAQARGYRRSLVQGLQGHGVSDAGGPPGTGTASHPVVRKYGITPP